MTESQNGRHLEEVVLETLRDLSTPTHMGPLVDKVHQKEPDVDEFEVRRAVWRLLDRRTVDLTLDRRLKATAGAH